MAYRSAATSLLLFFPFYVFASPASLGQNVIHVDDNWGPGIQALEIQAAVNIAHDGDLILVHPGVYSSFTVDGKSLTIHGIGDAPTGAPSANVAEVKDGITIKNLAPGQEVNLRRLQRIEQYYPHSLTGISILDCEGDVFLEEMYIKSDGGNRAGWISNASSVAIVESKLIGLWTLFAGTPGLGVESSHVAFFGSTISGGGAQVQGNPGLNAVDSFLYFSHTKVNGGNGGSAYCYGFCEIYAGNGGPGVVADDSEIYSLNSTFTGGYGGAGVGAGLSCYDGCPSGSMGPKQILTGTSFIKDQGPYQGLHMTTSSPVGAPGTISISLEGPPLTPVFLGIGDSLAQSFNPSLKATVVVSPPYTVVFFGTTSAGGLLGGGKLKVDFPVPALFPGMFGDLVYAQAGYLDSSNQIVVGGASGVILLP